MVDERMEALALSQHGLISHDQALSIGLTESAIRHRRSKGRLADVLTRVYRLPGAIETPHLRALAAVLAAGDGAVLSHGSAAALFRLPGFALDPVVVTIARKWRRPLHRVRVEQSLALAQHHRRVVDGIPCTSLARTLFDLCGDVHARRAERALDTALARRAVRIPALWRVLDDLAEHGRAGTVSRLVVEVDSAEFHDGLLDRRSDAERDRRLETDGWTVLRFRWRDVVDRPEAVAHSIRFRYAIAPL